MMKFLFYCSLVLLVSCHSSTTEDARVKTDSLSVTEQPLKYAKQFKIKKNKDYTIIELFGDKTSRHVTSSLVLYRDNKPNLGNDYFYIKTPVSRVACMSSIYTTMMQKLNCDQYIVAIDNVDYYNDTSIQKRVRENNIIELSKGPKVEIEKTIVLNPDLFLTFGMGNPKEDVETKIIQAGIPVAITLDHVEETPLARAEWLKFVACFFNKESLGDSLFTITETNYNRLKSLTQSLTQKPSVLTEIKYGDAWYIPSGKSYMAAIINDAGGDYFWKDEKTGSTPLSFEVVYEKAKDCDFWINQYNINSKAELLSHDERYGLFKAFKDNKLYNNNKVQNKLGFSNYWETGVTNPDDILADLIAIFTPSLLPNHQLKYYKHIE